MELSYVFTILFVHAKITLQQVALNRKQTDFKVGNFLHLHDHRLNIASFATDEFQDEAKCVLSCLKSDECFSINVKKQSNGVLCDLLNLTMYQYPKNLTREESSSYYFPKVS